MRKIISIAVLFVYVSLSAIQAISIHYCHGNLESIEIFDKNPDCCDSEHSDHKACCDDVSIEIDFDTDHIYSEQLSIDITLDEVNSLYDLYVDFSSSEFYVEKNNYPELNNSSPPLELYIIYSFFVFYG